MASGQVNVPHPEAITGITKNNTNVSQVQYAVYRRYENVISLAGFIYLNTTISTNEVLLTGCPIPNESSVNMVAMDADSNMPVRLTINLNGELTNGWGTVSSGHRIIFNVTYIV